MTELTLPIVSIEARPSDLDAQKRIATRLDHALQDVGFCYLECSGVDDATVEEIFKASQAFHRLPEQSKRELTINEFHRGYISPASSVIRSSSVAKVTRPNLSDSLMLMHEVNAADTDFGRPLNGPNQWPDLPGFKTTVERYTIALEGLSRYVTRLIAIALGQDPGALDAYFAKPTTWLRLLRYPPLPNVLPEDQFSAAPHTDYGFITLLAQDKLGGLEVRSRDNTWRPAPPLPGTFILNVADMLERWSDGRWPSTPHRVRNMAGVERFSVPYFFDPHIDVTVTRLPGLEARTNRPPAVFGDYVMERLNRNYAYRQTA